ncbi:MAG: hypothetical protein AABW49_01730 [Nanoarchaeota archaeon]
MISLKAIISSLLIGFNLIHNPTGLTAEQSFQIFTDAYNKQFKKCDPRFDDYLQHPDILKKILFEVLNERTHTYRLLHGQELYTEQPSNIFLLSDDEIKHLIPILKAIPKREFMGVIQAAKVADIYDKNTEWGGELEFDKQCDVTVRFSPTRSELSLEKDGAYLRASDLSKLHIAAFHFHRTRPFSGPSSTDLRVCEGRVKKQGYCYNMVITPLEHAVQTGGEVEPKRHLNFDFYSLDLNNSKRGVVVIDLGTYLNH